MKDMYGKRNMNCLETQKKIRDFLDGSLPDREMEAFLAHMESCRNCRDELEIYYAVDRAMRDDDDDLPTGWEDEKDKVSVLLRTAARRVSIRKGIRMITVTLRVIAVLAIAAVLLTVAGVPPFSQLWEGQPSIRDLWRRSNVGTYQTEMLSETEAPGETAVSESTQEERG